MENEGPCFLSATSPVSGDQSEVNLSVEQKERLRRAAQIIVKGAIRTADSQTTRSEKSVN